MVHYFNAWTVSVLFVLFTFNRKRTHSMFNLQTFAATVFESCWHITELNFEFTLSIRRGKETGTQVKTSLWIVIAHLKNNLIVKLQFFAVKTLSVWRVYFSAWRPWHGNAHSRHIQHGYAWHDHERRGWWGWHVVGVYGERDEGLLMYR